MKTITKTELIKVIVFTVLSIMALFAFVLTLKTN